MKISRKKALNYLAKSSLLPLLPGTIHSSNRFNLKSQSDTAVKHSVCRWPYSKYSIEQLAENAKKIGIQSIELLVPSEIRLIKEKYGLECAIANGSDLHIPRGFNDPDYHRQLQEDYALLIPQIADLGVKNIICFSGNRNGMNDKTGIENAAKGLDPVVKLAARYGVTVSMELLNSSVDHKDYMCDNTQWGVNLVDKLGLDNFKLLYDIYHMQIMEGDVIRTIRTYRDYISHYHTGGVPGRNEIDETQELNYQAIVKAIYEKDYNGYVGQEFIPKNEDVFKSLKLAIMTCNASW